MVAARKRNLLGAPRRRAFLGCRAVEQLGAGEQVVCARNLFGYRVEQTSVPILGLVCQTLSEAIRYRTITRTRLFSLGKGMRTETLRALYEENARRLQTALDYCDAHDIRLYRLPTGIFPFMDHEEGEPVIAKGSFRDALRKIGSFADARGIRLVSHPDQFVVLNSERPEVIENSVRVLAAQAGVFDLLGMPQTPWSAITLHGGKGGRAPELVAGFRRLPGTIRNRIALENDERTYGSAAILEICNAAGVPMIFDAHHHLVKERLASYDDPSIAAYTAAAAATWPSSGMQIVHISNGATSLHDMRHSDMIAHLPAAFADVAYIEVEAKGKEQALFALRARSQTKATRSRASERSAASAAR